MRFWLAATLIFIAATAGCDGVGSEEGYIPGEVIAAFKNVEPTFVEEYARERGITVRRTYFPPVYLVRASVRSGSAEGYLAALATDPLVDTARVWMGDQIEVVFRRAADEAYARALVAAQGGLTFGDLIRSDDLVLFAVPAGQEGRWVRRLKQEAFVLYAERNQRVYPR